jgi:hypothetical protein
MESLAENQKKLKGWWLGNNEIVFFALSVFLLVLLGGGLVRLFAVWQGRDTIVFTENKTFVSEETLYEDYLVASGLPGLVAASRKGIRYYYPWCGGLTNIKEANKVWFATTAEAKKAGYTLAKGCKGL